MKLMRLVISKPLYRLSYGLLTRHSRSLRFQYSTTLNHINDNKENEKYDSTNDTSFLSEETFLESLRKKSIAENIQAIKHYALNPVLYNSELTLLDFHLSKSFTNITSNDAIGILDAYKLCNPSYIIRYSTLRSLFQRILNDEKGLLSDNGVNLKIVIDHVLDYNYIDCVMINKLDELLAEAKSNSNVSIKDLINFGYFAIQHYPIKLRIYDLIISKVLINKAFTMTQSDPLADFNLLAKCKIIIFIATQQKLHNNHEFKSNTMLKTLTDNEDDDLDNSLLMEQEDLEVNQPLQVQQKQQEKHKDLKYPIQVQQQHSEKRLERKGYDDYNLINAYILDFLRTNLKLFIAKSGNTISMNHKMMLCIMNNDIIDSIHYMRSMNHYFIYNIKMLIITILKGSNNIEDFNIFDIMKFNNLVSFQILNKEIYEINNQIIADLDKYNLNNIAYYLNILSNKYEKHIYSYKLFFIKLSDSFLKCKQNRHFHKKNHLAYPKFLSVLNTIQAKFFIL